MYCAVRTHGKKAVYLRIDPLSMYNIERKMFKRPLSEVHVHFPRLSLACEISHRLNRSKQGLISIIYLTPYSPPLFVQRPPPNPIRVSARWHALGCLIPGGKSI